MVTEDQIQAILEAEPDPQRAADRLVKAANRAGGIDNITVVVLDAHAATGATTRPPGAAADLTIRASACSARTHPRSVGGSPARS